MKILPPASIAQIEQLVDGVPGWTPLDQLYSLFLLAYTAEAEGDILEVGSWCGRSASALALAANMLGGVRVHCVDLFPEKKDWRQHADGTYSFALRIGERLLGAYEEQTVWAEPYARDIAPIYARHNGVLDVFKQTMARNGFGDTVKPWKGDMLSFSQGAPCDLRCRLIFIDGDHSYDAVRQDIELAGKYLAEGGWICFDDAFSSYVGVDRAIETFIIDNPAYEKATQLTRKLFVARKRRQGGRGAAP